MSALVDITMPDTDQEGTESFIAAWFNREGGTVNEHEPLLEISTDKVSVEISAYNQSTVH